MGQKEAYQEKMEAQLEEMQAKIDVLEAKMKGAKADAKTLYFKQVKDLDEKRDKIKEKLAEMKNVGGKTWEEIKDIVENTFDEMKEILKKSKS